MYGRSTEWRSRRYVDARTGRRGGYGGRCEGVSTEMSIRARTQLRWVTYRLSRHSGRAEIARGLTLRQAASQMGFTCLFTRSASRHLRRSVARILGPSHERYGSES